MKRIIIVLISLVAIMLTASYVSKKWLENNLESLLNSNPDRAYQITYKNLDLNILLGGFDLLSANISPLKEQGTQIIVEVEEVQVTGLSWIDLVFSKNINVSEIIFYKPAFEILLAHKDSTKIETTKKVQQLFGDILSRGELQKFSLFEGSLIVKKKGEQTAEMAHIGKFSIKANGLETDSLQWKYPIPFKMAEFSSLVKDIRINLDDHSTFSCGELRFEPELSRLSLNDLSLKFNKNWLQVSNQLGKQIDLFEMDMKRLVIRGLGTKSQFLGEIDIRSEAIEVDSLVLKDHRDKNKPRPQDVEMPMFHSMVGSIPVGLKVDTILIKNSFVSYIELPEGKTEAGTIHFDNLYGSIYNITTLESFKSTYKQFEIDLIGQLNKAGKLSVRITVPYDASGFHLKAQMDSLEVISLNSTLQPMAGIEVKSGLVSKLELDMKATKANSKNIMVLHYTDLGLSILKEKEHKTKKRGLMSSLANSVIRTRNIPDTKHYIIADYISERNIYRGPFNFMWKSAKEGFIQIVPSKTAKGLMGGGKK